ncbi:MAG: phytanoyl-CoA dioxygenase family protein [Gammaproteobacteria bacterium]|nr:phytanoyl-CoA dioxygenase family protein [Gammaproteobacteria bacterium]
MKAKNELENMQVFGETEVGWCANTPVNETLDEAGNVVTDRKRHFGVADPYSPSKRLYDDYEVCKLREKLEKYNGYTGLDICEPHEIEKAKTIFFRDGFVVVNNLLDEETLARFREGSARVLKEILEPDGHDGRKYITETSRLPHRYSYGTTSASRQMLHDAVWASMVDLPTTTPLLTALFGNRNYMVTGAGGDLCLPGAVEYQHLHMDLREHQNVPEPRRSQAEELGVKMQVREGTEELDLRTQREIVDHTPPIITINFVMCDLTWENGPIRQIPGSHKAVRHPPPPTEEPEWMRMCTLVGAKAGAGVFRDNRAWHGATPNLSREIRSLPNVEYGAPWIARGGQKTMPLEIWETLSDHAKHLCRFVKADPGVWPAGAGFNHSLTSERKRVKEEALAKAAG